MSNLIPNEEHLHKIKEELKCAYKKEEGFWKQRSKQLWLNLGNKNKVFFHASTKKRKAMNKFSVIEDDKGQEVYQEEKIVKVISEYFQ